MSNRANAMRYLYDLSELIKENNKKRKILNEKRTIKLNHTERDTLYKLYKMGNININQRTLSKDMIITPQGLTKVLVKLEENNLIERKKGNQKNENLIFLTKKGKELAKELEIKIEKHAKNFFKSLNDEEIKNFNKLLTILIENNLKIKDKKETEEWN